MTLEVVVPFGEVTCESSVFAEEWVGGDALLILNVPTHAHSRAANDNGYQASCEYFFDRSASISEKLLVGVLNSLEQKSQFPRRPSPSRF